MLEKLDELKKMTVRMRKTVLETALHAGAASSHFGGALSLIEILAVLFGEIMNLDAAIPEAITRDRFILSKGHGCLGYYAALYEKDFLTHEDLMQFEKTDGVLMGHPIMNRKKGIEFSNGSLGMGLSLGIGVAIAGKKRQLPYTVYVVMGDGECNEGSVWEALMAAAHFQLDNLVVIIDRNQWQQTGSYQEIMNIGDLAAKVASFDWETVVVDGHDLSQLYNIFRQKNKFQKPKAVIAHTVKGKGFSFSENNNDWHHKVLTQELYETALGEILI